MRFLLLACDYNGTLAREGRVGVEEERALERLRASGRKIVLVTGRLLEDLLAAFPKAVLCDRIVAENGAVLHAPETRETRLLAKPPPEEFARALERRIGVPPAAGRVIVATGRPHEAHVLEVIRELGLEFHVTFNRGAVMALPPGVTKATGLAAALADLGVSPHNVVGVGDAENDHAFLDLCECAVAARDALPAVRARADWVTPGGAGRGVTELVERILATDLRELEPALERHAVPLGEFVGGGEVRIPPYDSRILLAGPSRSGKSSLARAVLEHLIARAYQVCLVDPEGDHTDFEEVPALGGAGHAPRLEEIARLLARPEQSLALNLLGVPLEGRPAFFEGLLGLLRTMGARVARPHWLVVDEAHHVLPAVVSPARAAAVVSDIASVLLVTVSPDRMARPVLESIDRMIALGEGAPRLAARMAEILGEKAPRAPGGGALFWDRISGGPPVLFRPRAPRTARRRHRRKYAEGELGPDKSFYFRGPEGKLNLRAQNLLLFVQLAEGVDDETWSDHLARGDYSRWIRESIKDEDLAAEVEEIERARELSPREARSRLRERIEARYAGPA